MEMKRLFALLCRLKGILAVPLDMVRCGTSNLLENVEMIRWHLVLCMLCSISGHSIIASYLNYSKYPVSPFSARIAPKRRAAELAQSYQASIYHTR
jgi:hypothetical protein